MRLLRLASLASVVALAAAFLATSSCKSRTPAVASLKEDEAAPSAAAAGTLGNASGNPTGSVVDYAALCKAEVGLPATYEFPALDCLGGEAIPIKFTAPGEQQAMLTSETWERFDGGGRKCDNPHWLGGEEGCFPYDHMTRFNAMGGNRDVVGILNCRQKYLTDGRNNGMTKEQRRQAYADVMADTSASDEDKARAFVFANAFNDLGFIVRNQRSGATCYFTIFGYPYLGKLPAVDKRPSESTLDRYATLADPKPPKAAVEQLLTTMGATASRAADFWSADPDVVFKTPQQTAQGQCVTCHDIGGWKHSPFIMSGSVDVPRNGRVPFLPVGEPFKAAFRTGRSRDVTTAPVDGQPQLCTSCHRLTSGSATCNLYIPWSVGLVKDTPNRGIYRFLTEAAKTHPLSHWMPDGREGESLAAWRSSNEKHFARMLCCCRNPDARGCKSKRYGPTTAEVDEDWTEGTGPASCEGKSTVSEVDDTLQWR